MFCAALAFSCGQWLCVLCVSMTSSLRPLHPATTRWCSCCRRYRALQGYYDKIFCCSAATLSRRGSWTTYTTSSSSSCVRFLLLLSVCVQCASFTHKLRLFVSIFGEFQAPPIGLGYELQRVESFTIDQFWCKYSWNDAEEDGGEKDRFGSCGHDLSGDLSEYDRNVSSRRRVYWRKSRKGFSVCFSTGDVTFLLSRSLSNEKRERS